MARYKAKWIYEQQCLRAGQIKAECEADNLSDFAKRLICCYCYELGDNYLVGIYESLLAIESSFGEPNDWPDFLKEYDLQNNKDWPAYVLSSSFGDEILFNPSATAIVRQISNEAYGDYHLRIIGF